VSAEALSGGVPMPGAASAKRVEGDVAGPSELRKHLGLYRRAINEGWPVTEAQKLKVIAQAEKTLDNPDASIRERMEAAKVFMAASGQNIKITDMALKVFLAERDAKRSPGINVEGNAQIQIGPSLAQIVAELRAQYGDDPAKARAMLERIEAEDGGNGNGKH